MGDGFWTTERIALLKRLWAQGTTATAIAAELGGLSRSAVLGKIFRLRLAPAKRAATQKRAKRKDERGQKRERGKAVRAAGPDTPRRRRAAKAKAKPATKARSKTSARKTLLELTNECCRWPSERARGGYFFCGAAGADIARGIPYCPEHMRRAYVVPPCMVTPAPSLLPCLLPCLLPSLVPGLPTSPPRSFRGNRPVRAA
jgi:GcrA cell cycle regulator